MIQCGATECMCHTSDLISCYLWYNVEEEHHQIKPLLNLPMPVRLSCMSPRFEVWEKKHRKINTLRFGRRNTGKFQPLGNEGSPFCRTEWFHIYVKMAFFHLDVWLIGQGG